MAEMRIFVSYSTAPRVCVEREVAAPMGCTAAYLLAQLRLDAVFTKDLASFGEYPEMGIWGKKIAATQVLVAGDRLELYRALQVDPKTARRERFMQQGAKTAGLFAKRRPGGKPGY